MATKDSADQVLMRAIGDELRQARMSAGWSRPDLVERLPTRTPVNTYACYEQGIRQCSIPRLVEICQVLGTSAPELLGSALRGLGLNSGRYEDLLLLRALRGLLVPPPAPREASDDTVA